MFLARPGARGGWPPTCWPTTTSAADYAAHGCLVWHAGVTVRHVQTFCLHRGLQDFCSFRFNRPQTQTPLTLSLKCSLSLSLSLSLALALILSSFFSLSVLSLFLFLCQILHASACVFVMMFLFMCVPHTVSCSSSSTCSPGPLLYMRFKTGSLSIASQVDVSV